MGKPTLIYCADGNPAFAEMAVRCGWVYGARLPSTVYQTVEFADQDWKNPNRSDYMAALAIHRPRMATVMDWEEEGQFEEVMSWAEEAAQHVTESVLIVPKVIGEVGRIPRSVNGKRVVLAYSVPTTYGGSPLAIWEFAGWPVHLLGGSPHKQMSLWSYFSVLSDVVSLDGNMTHQQAHRCRFWSPTKGPNGKWVQLSDRGDLRGQGANLEAFRLSLTHVSQRWDSLAK